MQIKQPTTCAQQVALIHLAVREALTNCLVNADYFQPWNVVIERFPDRIIMSNPGTIIPGKKQMLKGGISEPRNKNLFKMFNLIGIGDHAGLGVPDIFDVWKSEGLKEPQVEEQFGVDVPDRTTLILPLVTKEGDISKKSQEKSQEKSQVTKPEEMETRKNYIIQLIKNNEHITTPVIAQEMGLTERQVRTSLNQLRDVGKIRFEGVGKGGRWVICD